MSEPERLRLDLWLYRARFFKTRSLAGDVITGKGVRVERDGQVRKVSKAAGMVQIGDRMSFATKAASYVVDVVGLPERRGPAEEAQGMYETVEVVEKVRTPWKRP